MGLGGLEKFIKRSCMYGGDAIRFFSVYYQIDTEKLY